MNVGDLDGCPVERFGFDDAVSPDSAEISSQSIYSQCSQISVERFKGVARRFMTSLTLASQRKRPCEVT